MIIRLLPAVPSLLIRQASHRCRRLRPFYAADVVGPAKQLKKDWGYMLPDRKSLRNVPPRQAARPLQTRESVA